MRPIFERIFESKRPEHEFLPAVLEIQNSPPSPIGRAVLWSIAAFFTFALAWSILGQIEIIAVAPGKIVPNDRVKTIQPLENAVVTEILVKDGDLVKAGDVLVVLDTRQTQSDVNNISAQLEEKTSRLIALNELEYRITDREHLDTIKLPFPESTDPKISQRQQNLFHEQMADFRSAMLAADQQIRRQQEDLATSDSEIRKLEQMLPIVTKKSSVYKSLLPEKAVTEMEYLDLERQRIETASNLISERARNKSLLAALNQAKETKVKQTSETRVTFSREKAEVAGQISSLKEELRKAEARNGLQTLTAPIDGIVQGSTVFTVGGVVTEAEKIMQIVPINGGLEIEAYISNKDIGFVRNDQHVTVKIDSFNFTKYGTIDGTVLDISGDAFQDEKLGLIFKSRIALSRETMSIDGKMIKLGPGMSVTGEIVTGERRIIEFLLNPARKIISESWKER